MQTVNYNPNLHHSSRPTFNPHDHKVLFLLCNNKYAQMPVKIQKYVIVVVGFTSEPPAASHGMQDIKKSNAVIYTCGKAAVFGWIVYYLSWNETMHNYPQNPQCNVYEKKALYSSGVSRNTCPKFTLFFLQFWNEVATSLFFEFWSFSISASERPADLNG